MRGPFFRRRCRIVVTILGHATASRKITSCRFLFSPPPGGLFSARSVHTWRSAALKKGHALTVDIVAHDVTVPPPSRQILIRKTGQLYGHPASDFGRPRMRAQVANAGKRMTDRTPGAPVVAEAMIALAHRTASTTKYFRLMANPPVDTNFTANPFD
jgi:hypothetical protein